jgi:alpha-glucosidase (family GH31 glycosyl hydrolase)
MWLALWLVGCGRDTWALGEWTVSLSKDGAITATHPSGAALENLRLTSGSGSAEIEASLGSFRFDHVGLALESAAGFGRVRTLPHLVVVPVLDASGAALGDVEITDDGGRLDVVWSPAAGNRAGFAADCTADDHFLGLGAHAFDVDHVGEAFGLFVTEPGVGKSASDDYPVDWFATGTRHATSFPVPFALRPQLPMGLLLDASGRVDVDLCASSDRFSMTAWQSGTVRLAVYAAPDPVGVIAAYTADVGRPALPPPWVFGPWNDAIHGADRVREVAATLRASGASSSVLWTEDFKGAEQTPFGYHLTGEWTVDATLYPDAEGLAGDLESQGFAWFAYFSPFVFTGTTVWDAAVAADVLIGAPDGGPYTFLAPPVDTASLVDLSTAAGRDFVAGYLAQALDVGFDGWMADYGEWLPVDAVLASGEDALEVHNRYPEWWQATHAAAIAGRDASFFVRSGWTRTGSAVPVVWAGDQRTSFDPDDGLPTVLPLGLGLAAAGVPVFTHDVGGYQSLGNPPTTRELWFRWASLGAFTPILRTHHGAFDDQNWQFDSDEASIAHWAAVTAEHARLWPYRYGLAARASDEGIPMILPPALRYGGDVARIDAWLLGDALLVAPVTAAGATGRSVELPPGARWYDWWTREPVVSGWFDAAEDEIPVFAAAGTTVPRFVQAPDTFREGAGLVTLADVDRAREVLLFGGGGAFTEADGTTYMPRGAPTGPGEATEILASGEIAVAGVTLAIDGPVERTYTMVVIP